MSVATIVDDGTVIMASRFVPSFGGIAAGGGAVGVIAGAVIMPPQPPQLLQALWQPPHELQLLQLLQQLDCPQELQPLLMPMQPQLE